MELADEGQGKTGEPAVATRADKMPKSVMAALLWIVAFYVVLQITYVFPDSTSPWTLRAFGMVIMAMMAYSCVMICLRNVVAVILAFLAVAGMFVMLGKAIGLFVLLLAPSLLMIMPPSLKWWRGQRRFATTSAVLAALSIGVCWVFMIAPSLSSDDISNLDPMLEFSIGGKARHDLDKSNRHRYGWWRRGNYLGACRVGYDRNEMCRSIELGMVSRKGDPKREYAEFCREMKSRCEYRFGPIAWRETVTDKGLPMFRGTVNDGTTIDIFSESDCIFHGKVLIYRDAP